MKIVSTAPNPLFYYGHQRQQRTDLAMVECLSFRHLPLDIHGCFVSEDTDLQLRAILRGVTLDPGFRRDDVAVYVFRCDWLLGYSEVASHWLRELLIAPNWHTFRGFSMAMTKSLLAPLSPGVRRYKKSEGENQR